MAYLPNSTGEDQWDDIITPGFALGTGNAAPALVSFSPVTNMRVYGFSGTNSTPDELFAFFELPHGYKEGTDLYPHVHWQPNDNNVANVKWQVAYAIAPVGGNFTVTGSSAGVEATVDSTSHLLTTLAPVIPGLNLKIGSIIACRLFRDATDPQDTYTGLANLLSFGIHFQKDSLGSRQIATK
jgi:hypothetical protein